VISVRNEPSLSVTHELTFYAFTESEHLHLFSVSTHGAFRRVNVLTDFGFVYSGSSCVKYVLVLNPLEPGGNYVSRLS
jgi:hypothetical protein